MTVKMILVKGPALRKLIMLFLLTFAGLGYPPKLCEAIQCHECGLEFTDGTKIPSCESGFVKTDSGCTGEFCLVVKIKDTVSKGCQRSDFDEGDFQCAQKKLKQSGNCLEGTIQEVSTALKECQNGDFRASQGSEAKYLNFLPGKRSGSESGGQLEPTDYWKNCRCSGDLCNTNEVLGIPEFTTKGTGEGGSNSAGLSKTQGLETIITWTLSMGALNGFFYWTRFG